MVLAFISIMLVALCGLVAAQCGPCRLLRLSSLQFPTHDTIRCFGGRLNSVCRTRSITLSWGACLTGC